MTFYAFKKFFVNSNSKMIYKGKWKDHKKHDPNATYIDILGRTFKGPWIEDRRHGVFTVNFKDGTTYKGTIFEQDTAILNGTGIATKDNISFNAEWENGIFIKKTSNMDDLIQQSKIFLKKQLMRFDELTQNVLYNKNFYK